MKPNRFLFLLVLLSLGIFLFSGCNSDSSDSPAVEPALADSQVAEWNETTMSLTPALGTHMGMRTLAMVHTAIYDAVMAFDGEYASYHVTDSPPAGASRRAAAAAAAHQILSSAFSADTQRAVIQARYESQLAQIADGPGKDAGIAFGRTVAQAVQTLRSTDGAMAAMQVAHPDGTEPGEWRRTASGEPVAPGWGQVTPWTMTAGDQFDQGGPPPLASPEYAADFEEVRQLGAKGTGEQGHAHPLHLVQTSTTRTEEQSHLALFWDPHVPAKWNSLAREISRREELTLPESARLFAMLSVTLADAAISGWNMKYKYNFWRPETAIRLGDADTNDQTIGDAAWEPFLTTPAFPEYISGHSLTCTAAATVLGSFLGTDAYDFTLSTMGIPQPRAFSSFLQAAQEAGRSRIYGGIHFQFANEHGQLAGTALGNHVFENFFRPL